MLPLIRILARLDARQLGWVALGLSFGSSVIAISVFYFTAARISVATIEMELYRLTEFLANNVAEGLGESRNGTATGALGVSGDGDGQPGAVSAAVAANFQREAQAIRQNWPGIFYFELLEVGEVPRSLVAVGAPSDPAEERAGFLAKAVETPGGLSIERHPSRGGDHLHLTRVILDDGAPVALVSLEYDQQQIGHRLLPMREAALFATLIALILSYAISKLSSNLRTSTLLTIAERQNAAEQMRLARDEAEQARQAETDFVAIVAHDLKNPLAAIRGFCQMAELKLDRQEPTGARLMVSRIADTSGHLLHIVENLLANAAVRRTGFRLHNEVYDLRETVEETYRLNASAASKKGITIRIDAPESAPIEGDRVRLLEAVDNLLNNAVKYSYPETQVQVDLHVADDAITLAVKDQGPGFTEEDLALVFQQFQRLSAKPTGGESSIGLGLSIAKTIIEAHGGTVFCQNGSEARGALFKAILPRSRRPLEARPTCEDCPPPTACGASCHC